jgi:ATP-dependent helicase/nuclease subunit B
MTLHLVFGWYLDGPCFPETADGSQATLGKLIVGPAGLINQLALRHGLLRPLVPQAVRIANYLAALTHVDDSNQFYSRSFQIDAWSTASYLLVLRDQLVSAGWKPEMQLDGPPKLRALRLAETVAENITGVADITRDVMTRVRESRKRCDISSVKLIGECERLPALWQELLTNMTLNGTDIQFSTSSVGAPADSDLGKIQRMFAGADGAPLSNDGTFTLLEADDELQASEAVAAYLGADLSQNENLVIVRGANTALLDEACSIQGLPRIGGELKSRWRSIPQLLPLSIANRWEPPDALALLEFLSLPMAPLPRNVGYRFARALRLEPGFGSLHWREAWSNALEENVIQDGTEQSTAKTRSTQETFERELKYWLTPPRYDPHDGIPTDELIELSRRIQRWTLQKAHGDDSSSNMLMELHALCKCFAEAVKGTSLTKIPKTQLDRITDAVFKDGVAAPGSSAEASTWSHVDVPGQVWNNAVRLIWWGCVGNRSERFHFPWSVEEVTALSALGLSLEHPSAETLRQADSWRLCLSNIKETVLLVRSRVSAGEPTMQHPFWTELSARLSLSNDNAIQSVAWQAHNLYENSSTSLGGRILIREKVEPSIIPSSASTWEVQRGLIAPRSEESSSSIELLLGCPMAWTLRYQAQMHPGSMLSVPEGDKLSGNLIHSCIHKLYEEKTDWTPDDAANRVTEIFDEQVREIALPFLLPGKIVERTQTRKALSEAIFDFQKLVQERGFRVFATEVRHRTSLLESHLVGQLDLVLRDQNLNEYVVDFKWSGDTKYRRDEIRQGRHLQLACYASLRREFGPAPVDAGYYMVKQRQLLSATSNSFPFNYVTSPTSLENLWESALVNCENEFAQLFKGRVCAKGVESPLSIEGAAPSDLISPPCKFCDYGYICGKKEYGC